MKKSFISSLQLNGIVIFLSVCFYLQANAQQVALDNPSFDFTPALPTNANAPGIVAAPWIPASAYFNCPGTCSVGPTPDSYPDGLGGVPASDGTEYVGMAGFGLTGQYTGGEAMYQQLICPLLAGVTYTLTMDVRMGTDFLSGTVDDPAYIGMYAANTVPANTEFNDPEILTTVLVTNATWETKTFTFTPTQDYDYLIIGAGWSQITGFGSSYIFIDNMTNTTTSCGIQLNLSAANDTICNGSCTDLTGLVTNGTPPYTVTWDNGLPNGVGPTQVCPTQTTTYTAIVVDAMGETDTSDVTVTVIDYPIVSVTANADTICAGSSVQLTASGAADYDWSNGLGTSTSVSDAPTATTTYTVVGSNWQCMDTASIEITVIPPPTYDLDFQNPSCFNSTDGWVAVSNVSSPNYSSTWNGNPGDSLLTIGAGTYDLELVDIDAGCTVYETIVLINPSQLTNSFVGVTTICIGDSTQISSTVNGGTPGYTFNWSDASSSSSTTYSDPMSGTLGVEITDANGCSITDSIDITIELPPQLNIPSNYSGCEVLTVTFLNSTDNGTNYQWDFGDGSTGTGTTPTHDYVNAGSYIVSVSAESSFGCSTSETYDDMVIVFAVPKIELSAVTTVLYELQNDPLTLIGSSTFSDSCVIDFGDGTVIETCDWNGLTHEYSTPGNYIVTINSYNEDGCYETAQLVVTYHAMSALYVPNTFSPDGDAFNNVFMAKGDNIDEFEMNIFNRWGQLLFTTSDMDVGWDGTFAGKRVQDGTYVYTIRYKTTSYEYQTINGHVNIIR